VIDHLAHEDEQWNADDDEAHAFLVHHHDGLLHDHREAGHVAQSHDRHHAQGEGDRDAHEQQGDHDGEADVSDGYHELCSFFPVNM
jgi:hypothetical protein